jgi:hypothetical protein
MLAIERLGWMTRELLIVGTKAIPEVPGVPQAAVYFPGLTPAERQTYAPCWGEGITAAFDPDPIRGYANWWWGLTPSALRAMVGKRFDIVESIELPFSYSQDNYFAVGRRRRSLDEETLRLEAAIEANR